MKRFIFCLFLLIIPFNIYGLDVDTYSKNIILYNLNDDSVLYEKNSEDVVSIASTTKIMTAIVALENIDNLDKKVVLTYEDFVGLTEANASQAGFLIGEEVTYKDLLCGLLLPSGADAAQALSRLIAGSVDSYVELMNNKAIELGLSSTHFSNTTGLDDEEHYSSARDVSKMLKYAIKNNDFLDIIKMDYYTTSNNKHRFKNTILKMQDLYDIHDMDYLIGGKTGTTGDAGLCLATIAEKDGVSYMLITLGAPYSREVPYNLVDHKNVYEYYMNNYSYQNVLDTKDIIVTLKGEYLKEDSISFNASKVIDLYLENGFKKSELEYKYDGVNIITHEMKKGDRLGVVRIIYNGKELASDEIILDQDVQFDLIKYLKANKWISYIVSIIILLILSFIFIFFKKKKRLRKSM